MNIQHFSGGYGKFANGYGNVAAVTENLIGNDSWKHNAIIPQVNESLEEIEDRHYMLDIEIIRNSNAFRYFMTNRPHSVAFSSAMIQLEMNAIYGNDALILEVFAKDPEFIYPMIVKRLKERAVQLKQKLQVMAKWSMNFEKVLPIQRKNMYFPHFKTEIPEFSEIEQKPISFDPSFTFLLNEFIDVYCKMVEEKDPWIS